MKTTTQKIALLIAVFTLLFATNINAQAGSTCGNPLTVTNLPFNDAGNTSTFGDNYNSSDVPTVASGAVTNGTGSSNYLNGDDVVYAYTPTCDQEITIATTNDNSWIGLWAFEDCPFSSTVGYHTSTSGTTREISNLAVTAGQTYYFVVSTWPSPQSTDYTISIVEETSCSTPPGGGIIPTACANDTYTMTASSTTHFYDDGGPGGNCSTDGAAGNFANAGCETVTTICAASGEYLIAEFLVLSMFGTNSGFDWMVIYDGPSTSAPILYDNRSGGPNNPDGTSCNYTASSLINCSTGECLTFRFYASSVVNREGWDALMTSTPIPCSPLPVELTFFTGNKTGNINHLSWETATETNNDYFILEHSTDGFSWNEITKEKGAGNSTKINTYFYDHRDFPLAINYYRLTQVDFDGKRETFEIVSIDNSSDRKLIKTVNMIGQEINENYKGVVIDYYDDNTVVKRYQK